MIYFHPGMNFMTCWATVYILLSSPILLTVCEGKAVCSLTKVTYKQKCKTGTHFQMVSKPYMFEALVTTCMLWSERDKGGWYHKKDKQQQQFFCINIDMAWLKAWILHGAGFSPEVFLHGIPVWVLSVMIRKIRCNSTLFKTIFENQGAQIDDRLRIHILNDHCQLILTNSFTTVTKLRFCFFHKLRNWFYQSFRHMIALTPNIKFVVSAHIL